jgi:hypothetical protein
VKSFENTKYFFKIDKTIKKNSKYLSSDQIILPKLLKKHLKTSKKKKRRWTHEIACDSDLGRVIWTNQGLDSAQGTLFSASGKTGLGLMAALV